MTTKRMLTVGGALMLVVVSLAAMIKVFFFAEEESAGMLLRSFSPRVHYADNPAIDVGTIQLKAFYVVPKDLRASARKDWQTVVERALEQVEKFYTFQLEGVPTIVYELYPAIIIGEETRRVYDGIDTSRGNPHALISVRKELLARVFDPAGDLYRKPFSHFEKNAFSGIAIFYEGVGASATLLESPVATSSDTVLLTKGEVPALLVSTAFLGDAAYRDYGISVVAHEFGHLLGLRDGYDAQSGELLTDDIMGAGRLRPLDYTYLSAASREHFGLAY